MNAYHKLQTNDGTTVYAFLNDSIYSRLKNNKIYEPALYYFFSSFLSCLKKENVTCIDIGANIGCHTLTMAKYSGLVISYEPVPFIFSLLKKNIYSNSFENIKPFNCGLSDKNENCFINIGEEKDIGRSSIHFKENSSLGTKEVF